MFKRIEAKVRYGEGRITSSEWRWLCEQRKNPAALSSSQRKKLPLIERARRWTPEQICLHRFNEVKARYRRDSGRLSKLDWRWLQLQRELVQRGRLGSSCAKKIQQLAMATHIESSYSWDKTYAMVMEEYRVSGGGLGTPHWAWLQHQLTRKHLTREQQEKLLPLKGAVTLTGLAWRQQMASIRARVAEGVPLRDCDYRWLVRQRSRTAFGGLPSDAAQQIQAVSGVGAPSRFRLSFPGRNNLWFRLTAQSRQMVRLGERIRASALAADALGALHLSFRCCTVLEREGSGTVKDLLALSKRPEPPRGTGTVVTHEILQAYDALGMAVTETGSVDRLLYARARGFVVLPEREGIGADWFIQSLRVALASSSRRRGVGEIFLMRYGKDATSPRTFAEVGRGVVLSRERIRQIVDIALTALSEALIFGDYRDKRFFFRPEFCAPFRAAYQSEITPHATSTRGALIETVLGVDAGSQDPSVLLVLAVLDHALGRRNRVTLDPAVI
jgi:hypothetical protein